MPSATPRPLKKEVFITTGATAPFTELIEASLAPSTLHTLSLCGFTKVTLQTGDAFSNFEAMKPKPEDAYGIEIRGFQFNRKGLRKEMMGCKPRPGVSMEGLVISHAGSGSILDAMRLGLPLIVVPNEQLLDNHQEDLASELERQGYVTKASVQDLSEAILQSEGTVQRSSAAYLPQRSISPIVDDVLGYEEDPRTRLD